MSHVECRYSNSEHSSLILIPRGFKQVCFTKNKRQPNFEFKTTHSNSQLHGWIIWLQLVVSQLYNHFARAVRSGIHITFLIGSPIENQ